MESMHEAGLEDGVYFAPLEASLQVRLTFLLALQEVHEYVRQLPMEDRPDVFFSDFMVTRLLPSNRKNHDSSFHPLFCVLATIAVGEGEKALRLQRAKGAASLGTCLDFMHKWLEKGPRTPYWLPGFFFPQQIGCEMTGLEAREVKSAPPTGAYVYGLFMEGGRFNRATLMLEDSMPRQLLDQVSCIWLKPVVAADYRPTGLRIHQIDWPHQRHEVVFRRTWTCFSTCSSFTKSNLSARTANRVDFVKLLPPSASIVTACPPGAVDWRKKAKETWEE
eukprot:gene10435-11558_t